MIGGTKVGEIDRTAELIEQINKNQGLYFVLMFLTDVGYETKDIKAIAERLKPKSIGYQDRTL